MKDTAAARKYSRALLLAVREQKSAQPEAVLKQIQTVGKLVRTDARLSAALSHAMNSAAKKEAAMDDAMKSTGQAFSPLVQNFFRLLIRKKRIGLVPLIVKDFEAAVDEAQGVIKATVRSAAALDEKSKKEMEKKLSALFGKTTVIEASIDTELLAGAVVKAGDLVIDNSLKFQLKNLRAKLG